MSRKEILALVKYRLEQAQTALEDGKFLLEGGRSPQSIVNRAYYAMFYAALALLQQIGKVPSRHTGVISLFDTEFVVKGIFPKELSRDFHKTFELRQIFDYRFLDPASAAKAQEILQKAVRFVEVVSKYLLESAAPNAG
ncbi:MAG: HEPN domain-containing protein [Desulfobaccales bacterium]|jgi:uncharacterized protein (UPF0332 family)